MSDFDSRYLDHQAARAKANDLNKAIVFDALAVAGITSIHAEFDGVGDSGQIDDVIAYAGDRAVEFPSVAVTLHCPEWGQQEMTLKQAALRDAVEDLCYGCLEQTHPGWENNDGAYGEFTFDVAERQITLDFNGRFTDTWPDTHTF